MKLFSVFVIPLFCLTILDLFGKSLTDPVKVEKHPRAGVEGFLTELLPTELVPLGTQVFPAVVSAIYNVASTSQIAVLAFGIAYLFYFILAFFFPSISSLFGVPVATSAAFRKFTDAVEEVDFNRMMTNFNDVNLPESSFYYLGIQEEVCQAKAVCELSAYVVKRFPAAETFIRLTSKFLPGMKKYNEAIMKGIQNSDCSSAFSECVYSPE